MAPANDEAGGESSHDSVLNMKIITSTGFNVKTQHTIQTTDGGGQRQTARLVQRGINNVQSGREGGARKSSDVFMSDGDIEHHELDVETQVLIIQCFAPPETQKHVDPLCNFRRR